MKDKVRTYVNKKMSASLISKGDIVVIEHTDIEVVNVQAKKINDVHCIIINSVYTFKSTDTIFVKSTLM
jgi:Ni2+-binding GTPase involved in maturation of urease and hydrogenase